MKHKILHVIDSLKIGGAEKIVASTINGLKDFDHVLVILDDKQEVGFKVDCTIYSISYYSKLNLLKSILSLKHIIKMEKVDLVHAHLLTSSFLARLAIPKNLPIIFSVHNLLSKSAFKNSKLSYFLEKWTYKKNQLPIFVSAAVKNDYHQYIGIKGNSEVLYNHIDDVFFEAAKEEYSISEVVRLVAVGSLKPQKAYEFLITTLSKWEISFRFDIYGEGPLQARLEALIKELYLTDKVILKGNCGGIHEILTKYDIYVMPSHFEGFGIAPVEAMAKGLPTLVSDISVLKEVTSDGAIHFKSENNHDLIEQLTKLASYKSYREATAIRGKFRAKKIAKKQYYFERLEAIYLKEIGK